MDLGEVVGFNHSDFALTTSSPLLDNAIFIESGRIHPS
jgi:hypothetical protein